MKPQLTYRKQWQFKVTEHNIFLGPFVWRRIK